MPSPLSDGRSRSRWRSPWFLGGAALLALVAAAAVAWLLVFSPEEDVSNTDVAFQAETAPAETTPPEKTTDWPWYGYNKARTRYLPAEPDFKPPFKRLWSFRSDVLIEFSPIIVRDTLYVTRNSGGLYALNSKTGKVKWTKRVGKLNASSPAYDKGRIFAVTLKPGRITALRAKDGKVLWRKKLPGRSESSPVVNGGKVFFGCECGKMFAYDVKSGRKVWERELDDAVKAAPAYSDKTLYVGDYSGKMWALKTADGSVRWSSDSLSSGFGRAGSFYSTPAVAFGRVYVGSTDGRVYSYSKSDGKLAWSFSTGAFVYAGPAVADTPRTDPTVYIGSYDKKFYALDAKTGKVRWKHNAGGKISGAATVVGETVYYSNLGRRRTTGLSTRTGKKVYGIRRGAFNPIVSDGKRIYLTGYSQIYGLKPTDDE
ncbi:MAG: PQQ-binding-like beta-propeller repeat protein [Solirubrobacterales bacterium]